MASFKQEFIAHWKKKTDYCNVDIIKKNSCKGELCVWHVSKHEPNHMDEEGKQVREDAQNNKWLF